MSTRYFTRIFLLAVLTLGAAYAKNPSSRATGHRAPLERTVLSFRLHSDTPRRAKQKGRKLGLSFTHFSEIRDVREDPLKRIYSCQARAEDLSYLDVPIAKVYLHFLDDRLMNIVLFPAEPSLLDSLEQRIIEHCGRRGQAYQGDRWITDEHTKIRIYHEDKRGGDHSFVNFIDEDLAIEYSGYRRFWHNLPVNK
jgi:hypothetical protein